MHLEGIGASILYHDIYHSRALQIVESCNPRLENMENRETMENIKQKNKNTMFMTQNTLSMTQNTLFVNQMTQNTLFTAFIASVEKS